MPAPVSVPAFRILVPGGVLAWKSNDQNVVPPVAIEVMAPGEEVLRVLILPSQGALKSGHTDFGHRPQREFEGLSRGRVLVALCKVRALPPVRSGHDIRLPVMVQISEVRPFTPELIVELDALK